MFLKAGSLKDVSGIVENFTLLILKRRSETISWSPTSKKKKTIFWFLGLNCPFVSYYLERGHDHLTDLIATCADLVKIWNEVFCNEAIPIEHAEKLDNMRSKYRLMR